VQEVACISFVERRDTLDGLHRVEIRVKQFLFLRHVAELDIGPQTESACERGDFSDDGTDERSLARAIRTSQHDALTGADAQVEVFQQNLFWRVANRERFGDQNIFLKMLRRSEIEFQIPCLAGHFLAVFIEHLFDAVFDAQGAARSVSGSVAEESFCEFIARISLAAFAELCKPPQMTRGIVQFLDLVHLVAILVIRHVEFCLLDGEIITVIAGEGAQGVSLRIKLEGGCDRIVEKDAIM